MKTRIGVILRSFVGISIGLTILGGCGSATSELKDIKEEILGNSSTAVISSSDVTIVLGVADGTTATTVAVRLTNSSGTALVGCTPTYTTGVGTDTVSCGVSNSSGVATCTIQATVAGLRNSVFSACSGSIDIALTIPAAAIPLTFAITSGGPCATCTDGSAGSPVVAIGGGTPMQMRPSIGTIFGAYPTGVATDQTTAKEGCYAGGDGPAPCTPGNTGGGSFQFLVGVRGILLDTLGFTTD